MPPDFSRRRRRIRRGSQSERLKNEPLGVLRVVTDLYPEVLGGGALHAHLISKLQAEMGHEVTVLTSDHGDKTLPRREIRDGYVVRRHREWANPFGNSVTPGLVRILADPGDRWDVVHAHSHLYFSTNVAAVLAGLNDVPLIVTNHGLISQTAPDWVQRVFIPTIARFTFESADRVLCYTETDRDRLRERNVNAPISVIHNGIDCTMFRPEGSGERLKQVLFVGRLNRNKGVDRLFDAFAGLSNDFPNLTLKIVGQGPMHDRLYAKRSHLGLEDRVVLAGELSNEELPRVYSESAVFVLPSSNEGLPRTVLEALACETPVVTTALPQLEPVVDGAGFTVRPGATGELERAITRLLDDRTLRKEMGAVGRERVSEHYSWEDTVRRTTQLYYDVLGN